MPTKIFRWWANRRPGPSPDLMAADDASFVASLYWEQLGRAPDADGLAHYLNQLRRGKSRRALWRDLANSAEALQRQRWTDEAKTVQGGRSLSAQELRKALLQELPPFHPAELSRTPLPRLKVGLLGTCLVEQLLVTADRGRWLVRHWLMDSGEGSAPPALHDEALDVVVVQLTLRTILQRASKTGEGDLSYLQFDGAAGWLDNVTGVVDAQVAAILAVVPQNVPVCFLAFVEPLPQREGLLVGRLGADLPEWVCGLNRTLAETLRGTDRGIYLEINDLLRFHGDALIYDGYVTHATHAGLMPGKGLGVYSDVWARVAAVWRTWKALDPVKLIITDLDNTLWRGVAAEADEIVPWNFVEGWPLGYAEALLACKARGLLLAVASKNDEAVIRERFDQIWGGRLRLDDFCSVHIHWGPKSQSVQQILAETNILSEHAIFLDDSPQEIAEVQRAFPEIRTLSGRPERWRHVLLYAPETQVLRVTEESRVRTELVRAKRQRDILADQMDRASFLASLELRVTLTDVVDSSHPKWARALELLNKTNQFNTTGRRWSHHEMVDWLAAGGRMLAASAEDRLSRHGLVALALYKGREILQVVLSCRVFGLGIEQALLHRLMTGERKGDCEEFVARWIDTGRNQTCRDLWSALGWEEIGQDPPTWRGRTVPAWPAWIAAL